MLRNSWAFRLILGLLVVALSTLPASAGAPYHKSTPRKPNIPSKGLAPEPVTLKGTVQSISSTQIEVLVDTSADKGKDPKKNASDGKWMVATPPDTPICVAGEAAPDYLRPGLLVQFTAKAENQEVKEQVHTLTIVTTGTAHAGSAGTQSGSKHSGTDRSPAGAEPSKIIGQLGHGHDNKWPVRVGKKTLQIELADDVKIKVALNGRRLIGSGDKIVVHGEMIHGKPGACTANDVQVTLSQPLGAPKSQRKPAEPASEATPPDKEGN